VDRDRTAHGGAGGAATEDAPRHGWWGPAVASWPRPTARARRWSARYALVALVLATVVAGAVAFALKVAGVDVPLGVSALILDGAFLATMVPLYRAGALRAVDLGLRRAPAARSVGLALLALISYGLSSSVWHSLAHPPPVHSNFVGIANRSTVVIVLVGFAAVVSAPVVEEIFFRGFLYRSLRNRMGIVPACLIVGAVFGLGHWQYPLLVRPVLAAFGVIACLLYERTGSLLPGIAMHSYIDSSGFEFALTGHSDVAFDAFALLAMLLLLLGLAKFFRGSKTIGSSRLAREHT
jgi:uncharacterized protein